MAWYANWRDHDDLTQPNRDAQSLGPTTPAEFVGKTEAHDFVALHGIRYEQEFRYLVAAPLWKWYWQKNDFCTIFHAKEC